MGSFKTLCGFSFARGRHAPAEEDPFMAPGGPFDESNPCVSSAQIFCPKAGRGRLRIAMTAHPRASHPRKSPDAENP